MIMSCGAVPHPPLLALALRGDRGVVEGEDVADGAGAAGVELVTLHITSQTSLAVTIQLSKWLLCLVGLRVVVHGERGVAAAEAHPGVPVHEHDVAQLAGALGVLLVTPPVTAHQHSH